MTPRCRQAEGKLPLPPHFRLVARHAATKLRLQVEWYNIYGA
jgi:hypothetical protein